MKYLIPLVLSAFIVYWCRRSCKQKPKLIITFFFNSIKIKGEIMAVVLSDTQFVDGQLTPVNKKGKPAPVETGTVEYSSSNEAVFTVEEDASDETKFKVVAVGAGTAQLNYSADADLGQGVVPISGFTDIEVTAAQAVTFNVKFEEPKEQEETPTPPIV